MHLHSIDGRNVFNPIEEAIVNWRALQPLVSGEHKRRVVGGLHLLLRERRRRLGTVENLSVLIGDLRGQRGFSKEQLVIAVGRHKADL